MGFIVETKIPRRGRSNPHPGDKSVPWWGKYNTQFTNYTIPARKINSSLAKKKKCQKNKFRLDYARRKCYKDGSVLYTKATIQIQRRDIANSTSTCWLPTCYIMAHRSWLHPQPLRVAPVRRVRPPQAQRTMENRKLVSQWRHTIKIITL